MNDLATILPFPDRHGSRPVQRSEGMGAAGLLTLQMMARGGEAVPANVQRLDGMHAADLPERSPELLLALLLFGQLPAKKQERIKGALRAMAFDSRADAAAVKLHNLLAR